MKIVTTQKYDHHYRTYSKRKKRALQAVVTNLKRFIDTLKVLDAQASLSDIRANYIHREPGNIVAIGQEGRLGHGVTKTRLYTYPDIEASVIYLFCIGGEKRQSEDIQYCLKKLKKYGIESK